MECYERWNGSWWSTYWHVSDMMTVRYTSWNWGVAWGVEWKYRRSPLFICWCFTRGFITHITRELTLFTMELLMSHQICLLAKHLTTYITWKWVLTTMYLLMSDHRTLTSEFSFTHGTEEWPLSTMCTSMCNQRAPTGEYFTARITGKWPLSTMYLLMSH